ncbi:hypothetical protein [Pedobacter sp. MR2016-24]|uniref:hypothetical protein n=1 Tax=Pedobacter sp. MR2016-24 TaxID=2994466 RepID=UPI0022450D0A|nr:hypothetical protein [Pedobacter sp. MR2016-24]MCX2483410.1 hypothetical protein [Pedobacter sp. MR2016-24]
MALAWYAYIGGNPNAPASYALLLAQPGCVNGPILCAILAPSAGGPIPTSIPVALQGEIANALATGLAQPNPRPPFVPEVLMRP